VLHEASGKPLDRGIAAGINAKHSLRHDEASSNRVATSVLERYVQAREARRRKVCSLRVGIEAWRERNAQLVCTEEERCKRIVRPTSNRAECEIDFCRLSRWTADRSPNVREKESRCSLVVHDMEILPKANGIALFTVQCQLSDPRGVEVCADAPRQHENGQPESSGHSRGAA